MSFTQSGTETGREFDPQTEGTATRMSEEPIEQLLAPPKNLATGLIKAVRPRQWVKNALVLAAPLAAGSAGQGDVLWKVGVAFVAFCLAASAIYLVNDALDVEADRQHPTKRFRPIAAGVVPQRLAFILAVVFAILALGVSFTVGTWHLAAVIAVYLAVQLVTALASNTKPLLTSASSAPGFCSAQSLAAWPRASNYRSGSC